MVGKQYTLTCNHGVHFEVPTGRGVACGAVDHDTSTALGYTGILHVLDLVFEISCGTWVRSTVRGGASESQPAVAVVASSRAARATMPPRDYQPAAPAAGWLHTPTMHTLRVVLTAVVLYKVWPLRAAARCTPERGGAGHRTVAETRAVHEYQ